MLYKDWNVLAFPFRSFVQPLLGLLRIEQSYHQTVPMYFAPFLAQLFPAGGTVYYFPTVGS